jgi:hypothetical protein
MRLLLISLAITCFLSFLSTHDLLPRPCVDCLRLGRVSVQAGGVCRCCSPICRRKGRVIVLLFLQPQVPLSLSIVAFQDFMFLMVLGFVVDVAISCWYGGLPPIQRFPQLSPHFIFDLPVDSRPSWTSKIEMRELSHIASWTTTLFTHMKYA